MPDTQPIIGKSSDDYKPSPTHYAAVANLEATKHISEPGTVDLTQRQMIPMNGDNGKPDPHAYGSEYSARDPLPDGRHMSYPLIYDGKVHPREEAFKRAQDTNQHLGIYAKDTPPKAMDEAETALHKREIKVDGKVLNGDTWKAMNEKKPEVGIGSQTQNVFRKKSPWKIDTRDGVKGEVR